MAELLTFKETELARINELIKLGDLSLISERASLLSEVHALKLQENGNNVQTFTPDDVTTGTLQVETATVVGTITGDGNAAVVVTSAHMSNSPKSVSVAVLTDDDPSAVAGKIKTALGLDADVIAEFTISGTGADVVLTEKNYYGNDATLNISIDNDTCTGLTTAATSVNTTAGVASSDTLTVTAGKVFCSGDEEGLSLELPSAVLVSGQDVTVKKTDSGLGEITITTYGSEKIDGQDTYILDDQYDVVTVTSDGANWHILSKIAAD